MTQPGRTRIGSALAVVASFVLGLALLTPATPAAAAPPAMPASPFGLDELSYQRMLAQIPLDEAATGIHDLASSPGAGHDGLLNTTADVDHHILTVRWHGSIPADVRSLVARLRRSVDVRFAPARFSLAELDRAAKKIIHDNPGVVSAGPNADGSAVAVRAPATIVAAVQAQQVGVPVIVTSAGFTRLQGCRPNPSDTLGAGHRCYDLPAFWGGAVMVNETLGAYCTTAFGMHDSAGRKWMLTAAHCGRNGDLIKNGWENSTLGTMTDVPGPHDGARIATNAGSRYYDGPGIFNGDSSFTKGVAGQAGVSIGTYLCVSGSFGGVICNMQVDAVNQVDGTGYDHLAHAVSLGHVYTVGGDSGGPWFSTRADGRVTARGVHHGITCFDEFCQRPSGELFTPIDILSSDMGITVNIGSV